MAKLGWLSRLWSSAFAAETKFTDVAQLRAFVIEALRDHYDKVEDIKLDENDPAKFSAKIQDKVVSGDVTNLFGYLASYQDEDPKVVIDTYIRGIALERNVTAEKLVFVVRTKEYLDYVSQQTDGVVSEPLVGELSIVYMVDEAEVMSPIKTSETMGKSLSELHQIAHANVKEWLSRVKVDDSLAPIMLYYVEGNTMLSSSLVLLDEFWNTIEPKMPDDFYFTLPRRDQLFILDAKHADALPALGRLVELTFEDGFNLLSRHQYRRRNGKLEVVSR